MKNFDAFKKRLKEILREAEAFQLDRRWDFESTKSPKKIEDKCGEEFIQKYKLRGWIPVGYDGDGTDFGGHVFYHKRDKLYMELHQYRDCKEYDEHIYNFNYVEFFIKEVDDGESRYVMVDDLNVF